MLKGERTCTFRSRHAKLESPFAGLEEEVSLVICIASYHGSGPDSCVQTEGCINEHFDMSSAGTSVCFTSCSRGYLVDTSRTRRTSVES